MLEKRHEVNVPQNHQWILGGSDNMASLKDWLTVTWTQGGMPLRPEDANGSSPMDMDSVKARCGRAGSLAVTPGERLLELLRPAAPRRHSTAACATPAPHPPPPPPPHTRHFKYCPSDALPYCPPSALRPKIRITKTPPAPPPPPVQPPPIPQRTAAVPTRVPPPPRRAPPPPPRQPPAPTVRKLPPPPQRTVPAPPPQRTTAAPPRTTAAPPPRAPVPVPVPLAATAAAPASPPAAPTVRRSPSTGSNISVRQDSNVSSDSFSQTSSPSYTTKTMEAPLLPHQHINKKLASRLVREPPPPIDTSAAQALTKSMSTPASLQTIVRFQNGSNMSLHHKMLRDARPRGAALRCPAIQLLVNALALLAIAGGLAAYFNAYPPVQHTQPVPSTPPTPSAPPAVGAAPQLHWGARNPAPGVCLPVIASFCLAHRVPYNFTIFPNYVGHFGQRDAQQDLEIYDAVVDVRCYELTALFLCSVFVPKCGPLGHMVRPCKSLCEETMRRCGFFLEVFGLTMPDYLHCDMFPDSTDTNVCIGLKEVREAKHRAQKAVCSSGFQCDERRCIPADWRCDGHVDCGDQTDELNCRACRPGALHCGQHRCVDKEHFCDGTPDCPWGQDERNCLRLSDSNGDVGRGELQLFRPQLGRWQAACIAHWGEDAPRTVCGMLGYQVANSSMVEERASAEALMWRRLQRRERSPLREWRDCSASASTVRLVCSTYVCGKRRTHPKPSSRIVGGVEANPGDWPFLAAILGGPEEVFYCAGVLIADQWVLTASHCVGNHTDVSGWTIQLGITRRRSHAYYGQKMKVRRVVPHPMYNIGVAHDNDIALFQLNEQVSYHEHLSPVCLPPPDRVLNPGTLCTVIGWGKRDDKDMSEYEPAVNEVEVPVLNRDLCNAWLEHRDLNVTEGMICAGYPEGGKDACQGDSGGPLLCQDPDDTSRWYVGGIVSWGIKCAHPRLPGVYAYVPKYVPWILKQMESYD